MREKRGQICLAHGMIKSRKINIQSDRWDHYIQDEELIMSDLMSSKSETQDER